jgi:DNA polymerase-3 subunit delta'
MDNEKAMLLASLSGGSIGNALELHKDDIFAFRTELLNLLFKTNRKDLFSLINLASYLGKRKKDIREGLNIMNTFFRDVLVFKEVKKNAMLINQDSCSFIAAYADRLSGEQLLQNIEQIEKAEYIIGQNVNKSLTLEAMAFKLNY